MYGRSLSPLARACFTNVISTAISDNEPPLSPGGSRLAILVYQGSDPTVPYQALVIRESAMLFLGFTPWGHKAFSAREPDAVEVYSPDSGDCTTPTPRRARTNGKMSPSN